MIMRKTAYIFLFFIFAAPSLSFGEQPLEALRQGVDKGIRILQDPRYDDISQKQDQQQKLWEATLQIFDFREFSRRVLASHWKKFSPQQRNEFSQTFAVFLGKFYLRRLQARYNGEKIYYVDQKYISKSRALVEIKVLWKNVEVPVKLRMKKKHGTWKVYDLSVLGINAVGNYRAQFHWVLQNKTPDQVIETIKEKIRNIEKDI
jgi:phospholipid transport system substrate-binding protein